MSGLEKFVSQYTMGEEIANSITHAVATGLSIAALVVLIVSAVSQGDAWHVVSFSIFGSTLILLYLASTLYHAIPLPSAKRILKTLDHSAIFLLIAGTYTPFMIGRLRGGWGRDRHRASATPLARWQRCPRAVLQSRHFILYDLRRLSYSVFVHHGCTSSKLA